METITKLLGKRWVRIIGIGVVFYFGLLANKENPDSLGNRLSANNLQKNFKEVQEKTQFIVSNIGGIPQAPENKIAANYDPLQNFSTITIQDVEAGLGEEALKCGDEAEFSYDLHIKESANQLEFLPNQKLIIGSNTNILLEKKMAGMKAGATRIINIPRTFKSSDQKIAFLQKFNEADLQYKITLKKITPLNDFAQVNCKANENNKNDNEK